MPEEKEPHTYNQTVRLPMEWYRALQELAADNLRTAHAESLLAIREHLERAGKLPKPGRKTRNGNT